MWSWYIYSMHLFSYRCVLGCFMFTRQWFLPPVRNCVCLSGQHKNYWDSFGWAWWKCWILGRGRSHRVFRQIHSTGCPGGVNSTDWSSCSSASNEDLKGLIGNINQIQSMENREKFPSTQLLLFKYRYLSSFFLHISSHSSRQLVADITQQVKDQQMLTLCPRPCFARCTADNKDKGAVHHTTYTIMESYWNVFTA